MAKVHVCNVLVLDNPAQFMSKLEFEITFECIEDLPEDLEWKIIYVGSAESEEYDQILDTVYVGPVPEGRHKFVFTADPPNPAKIPVTDVVGVTVILITCAYRGQVIIPFLFFIFSNALPFYRSQDVLGWSKFLVLDQKFIYIFWQSLRSFKYYLGRL